MNPRKTLTILSLLSAAGLLLVACGGTPAASSNESSIETVNDWETPDDYVPFEGSEADLTAHVTVWHTFGSGSSANFESISQIATEFTKRYPNIEIELVNHTSYDQIYADLRNAIPAGTTPTMAIAYPDHVAEYLYAGAVENMAGYVNDPIIGMGVDDQTEAGPIDDYYEAYLEESSDYAEPGVYSMPWSKSTEIMFYNKTYFDANGLSVPQTWDDLWNVSEQIKALNSNVTPFGYDSDDNLFITRCAQDDIPYTSSNENDRYLFDNDQAKAMVKELKEKYDEGLMITKGSSANSTYTSTMFTNQELYLTVGSTGGTNYNYTSAFDIGISAVPQSDTSNPKVISQGPSMCFFSSASQDQLYAAWLFYKFATNANNTGNLSTLSGYYGGQYVSNINRFSKMYYVTIQADPKYRLDTESLNNVFVRTESGEMAPLSQFVNLTRVYSSEVLNRFNMYNSIAVSGMAADGYSSGDAIKAIQEVAAQVLPRGYGYEFDGITREEAQTGSNTIIIFSICILLIYLLLSALYESFLLPFAVILAVPCGLMGSFLLAKIMGLENNIYLQTGIIMLIGLLSKTAILITEYAADRRRAGMSLTQAAVSAAKVRLRPILMTVLTCVFGMIPLVLSHGVGANGNSTLGSGVVGGMIVGTLALLFLVPTLFIVFETLQEKIKPLELDPDPQWAVRAEVEEVKNEKEEE